MNWIPVRYTFSNPTSNFNIYDSPFSAITDPNVLAASKDDGTLDQGTTTLLFPEGTRAAGLFLIMTQGLNPSALPESTVTIEDIDGNVFTEYVEFQGQTGEQRFIGFHSLSGISSISFTSAAGDNIISSLAMDNVSHGDIAYYSVSIDIKPESSTNSINVNSRGLITVAILTTEDFDATTVDSLSVTFAAGGAEAAKGKVYVEDVDSDGDLDLLLHFRTQGSGIACGDSETGLTGETFDGLAIEGVDSINTVGCH
jgi:hypothetical protein